MVSLWDDCHPKYKLVLLWYWIQIAFDGIETFVRSRDRACSAIFVSQTGIDDCTLGRLLKALPRHVESTLADVAALGTYDREITRLEPCNSCLLVFRYIFPS